MATLGICTPVDRIHSKSKFGRLNETMTRSHALGNIDSLTTSTPVPHSTDEWDSDIEFETSTNHGSILFVYLDDHSSGHSNISASLRTINNDVQTYLDSSTCLEFLRTSTDHIFLILPPVDKQLLEDFHNLQSVEAIFILNDDAKADSRYPKLYGSYVHLKELLTALKTTLQWFEETQMEVFVFEHDRVFLWSQLWKEELIRVHKSKALSSTKEKLVQIADIGYRGNSKFHESIKEFTQSYSKNDALQWCFISPFPSTFLHRAFQTHNTEHLQLSRFLVNDVSRQIQIASHKSTSELYKGMRMNSEMLDKLEHHVGQLISPKGYLQCCQSRKIALETASSLDHRPDLMAVLFKINFDSSVPVAELHHKDALPTMVFDVYTVFRVKYVSRGPVTVVKIDAADECGAKLARDYRMKHKKETVQTLLEHLTMPFKPAIKKPSKKASPTKVVESNEEKGAKDLLRHGHVDQSITAYQQIKPETAPVLYSLGTIFFEKKGDYLSARNYYEKALHMQEKAGEDESSTLTQLGIVHQNCHEYATALSYHTLALEKRKLMPNPNQLAIASNLIGMANAYWGQKNLTDALNYAQQALTINESIEEGNDANIATNLAILVNIHHNAGNTQTALKIGMRAITLMERSLPLNSSALAILINNVAAIQVSEGLFIDARQSLERALELCKKTLPEGHPKRVTLERNIQRIAAAEQENADDSESYA